MLKFFSRYSFLGMTAFRRAIPFDRRFSIATRLCAWFLFLTIVPLSIAGFVIYKNSIEIVKKTVTENLTAIADNKAYKIDTHMKKRKEEILLLAGTSSIIDALEKFKIAYKDGGIDSSKYKDVDRELRPKLTYYQKTLGYYDFFLISPSGDTVFTAAQEDDFGTNLITGPYKDSQLGKTFMRVRSLLKMDISEFEYYLPSRGPAEFILTPIIKNKKLLGVVAIQIKSDEIYKFAQDYSGLGKTGEIVLASRKGSHAVFEAPTRHDPEMAFKKKIVIGAGESFPVQEAVQGRRGVGIYYDYRNHKVLASWRYLPEMRWGMVVKIDEKEALAPINKLTMLYLLVGIITVCGVSLLSLLISKNISNPILKLISLVNLMASGDLTAIVKIERKDEIGDLAVSFNKMYTKRKKAEDDLIKYKGHLEDMVKKRTLELERTNKELEEFSYVASHDLQEPLRTLSNYCTFLQKDVGENLSKEAAEDIGFIIHASDQMRKLVQDLLLFSRAGRVQMKMGDVDLNECIKEVVSLLQINISEKKGRVEWDNLPVVWGDPLQLVRVLQNLIGNSLKFCEEKSPLVKVTARLVNNMWEITVVDNGIGIENKYLKQIFVPFQRLHGYSKFKGTGVGLSICRKIIQRHGGEVSVESEPGKGSQFKFTIKGSDDKKHTHRKEGWNYVAA